MEGRDSWIFVEGLSKTMKFCVNVASVTAEKMATTLRIRSETSPLGSKRRVVSHSEPDYTIWAAHRSWPGAHNFCFVTVITSKVCGNDLPKNTLICVAYGYLCKPLQNTKCLLSLFTEIVPEAVFKEKYHFLWVYFYKCLICFLHNYWRWKNSFVLLSFLQCLWIYSWWVTNRSSDDKPAS